MGILKRLFGIILIPIMAGVIVFSFPILLVSAGLYWLVTGKDGEFIIKDGLMGIFELPSKFLYQKHE